MSASLLAALPSGHLYLIILVVLILPASGKQRLPTAQLSGVDTIMTKKKSFAKTGNEMFQVRTLID